MKDKSQLYNIIKVIICFYFNYLKALNKRNKKWMKFIHWINQTVIYN